MKVEQARAELEVLEIERTNLTEKQMVGFVAGWKLAGATEVEQLAQGTVDRLNELLEDDGRGRQDFQIGKLIGYAHYWQELLRAMK